MKKIYLSLAFLSFGFFLISCTHHRKETKVVEIELPGGYIVELPFNFKEKREGLWELSEHQYLEINTANGKSENLREELNYFSSSRDSETLYKDKRLINTEKIKFDGFEGEISFYEKSNKGKRAGLVSLTSYIVFAAVQDDYKRFQITSISLSKNNYEEISKIIKSIKRTPNFLNIPIAKKPITSNSSSDTAKPIPSISKTTLDSKIVAKNGSKLQIFREDGFMIKCAGELKLDKLRIQLMKQNGMGDNSRPYHVYHDGTDYNINVSRFDQVLSGQNANEVAEFNRRDLDYYQLKFDEMSVENRRGNFKNNDAIYYENTQNGRTTKAVFFHYQMKSFMLQVTDDDNVEKKFQEFIKTFEII